MPPLLQVLKLCCSSLSFARYGLIIGGDVGMSCLFPLALNDVVFFSLEGHQALLL